MSKRFERVVARHRYFAEKRKQHRYYGAPVDVRSGGARFENALQRDERRLIREEETED